MVNNINNWAIFFWVRPNGSIGKVNRYGCNQEIRGIGVSTKVMWGIPLHNLRQWEEIPGFSLDRLIGLVNSLFGTDVSVLNEEQKQALERAFSGTTMLDLTNSSISAQRMMQNHLFLQMTTGYNSAENYFYYYIFCIFRHLYYGQTGFLNVIKGLVERDYTVTKREFYHLLASVNRGIYNFFPNHGTIDFDFADWAKDKAISNDQWTISSSYSGPADLTGKVFLLDPLGEYMIQVNSSQYRMRIVDETPEMEMAFSKNFGRKFFFIVYNARNVLFMRNVAVDKIRVLPSEKQKLYYMDIRSRHPSHSNLRRNEVLLFPVRTAIRLGSTSRIDKADIILNSIEAIENSSNKMLMKLRFFDNQVSTAPGFFYNDEGEIVDLATLDVKSIEEYGFPIIAKNIYGSRGTGNYKLDSMEELETFLRRRINLHNYIFEKFLNYAKEYRIHVSENGAFLIWRKLRRLDTPEDQKWFFNNVNCNWVGDEHELFDSPKCLDEMCNEAVKALKAVGLDIGGVDVRVMSNDRSKPKFAIIEINSACSFAERTETAYIEEINKLIQKRLRK